MRTMLTTTVVILCVINRAAPIAAQPAPAPVPERVEVARRLVLQGQVAVGGGLWGLGVRAAVGIHVPLGGVTR